MLHQYSNKLYVLNYLRKHVTQIARKINVLRELCMCVVNPTKGKTSSLLPLAICISCDVTEDDL